MTTSIVSRAKSYAFEPNYAVPPGRTLQETIESLGMDQRELATRTGLSPKHINQIIQGSATVTQETALRLERATGVPARLWNNLEMNYREQLAKLEERDQLEDDLAWLRELPVKELIARGKIEKALDPVLTLRSVLNFFGAANVVVWKRLWLSPNVAFRKSAAFKSKPGPMATWLRLGELDAKAMSCEPFDRIKFRAALENIRALTTESPETFVPKMQKLCAEAGVAVVFVPELKGAPACGAAQWLTSDKAVIQLSLRHKTNDQFWFSFFHEAGHILHDGKKEKFIDVDHEKGESEERANRYSSNILIPSERAGVLANLKSATEVVSFAKTIQIAPGIVVGRLQHDKVVGYHQFNALKVRFQWVDSD